MQEIPARGAARYSKSMRLDTHKSPSRFVTRSLKKNSDVAQRS